MFPLVHPHFSHPDEIGIENLARPVVGEIVRRGFAENVADVRTRQNLESTTAHPDLKLRDWVLIGFYGVLIGYHWVLIGYHGVLIGYYGVLTYCDEILLKMLTCYDEIKSKMGGNILV